MNKQTFNINFTGYWLENNSKSIPNTSGIYCVYECKYDSINNSVIIQKLIYIGEANKVRERIETHDKWFDWSLYVKPGNQLCFSYADVTHSNRNRIEAALIYKHKPIENADFKYSFPFERTNIILTGQTALLIDNFSVGETANVT